MTERVAVLFVLCVAAFGCGGDVFGLGPIPDAGVDGLVQAAVVLDPVDGAGDEILAQDGGGSPSADAARARDVQRGDAGDPLDAMSSSREDHDDGEPVEAAFVDAAEHDVAACTPSMCSSTTCLVGSVACCRSDGFCGCETGGICL